MLKLKFLIAIVGFAFLVMSCASPQPTGTIYFARGEIGKRDIYSIPASGGTVKAVISDPSDDYDPAFDGSLIFLSNRDGATLSFGYDESSGVFSLPDSCEFSPQFSYDKSFDSDWVVFIEKKNGRPRLMWIPREKTNPLCAADTNEIPEDPQISKTNNLLVYVTRNANTKTRTIIVKSLPDGKNLALFDTEKDDFHPVLSPDGFYVAFQSGSGKDAEIFVGYIPNGTMKKLAIGEHPCWGE